MNTTAMNTNYTMKQAVKEAFNRIWDYEGRSTRAAFWKFQLASTLFIILFAILFYTILGFAIFNIYQSSEVSSYTTVQSSATNPNGALQISEVSRNISLPNFEADSYSNTTSDIIILLPNFEADSYSNTTSDIIIFPLLAIGILVMMPLIILLTLINLSLTCRRIADSGKNPLFILLSILPMGNIVIFVFCCFDSQRGTNQWGPSLKYPN